MGEKAEMACLMGRQFCGGPNGKVLLCFYSWRAVSVSASGSSPIGLDACETALFQD